MTNPSYESIMKRFNDSDSDSDEDVFYPPPSSLQSARIQPIAPIQHIPTPIQHLPTPIQHIPPPMEQYSEMEEQISQVEVSVLEDQEETVSEPELDTDDAMSVSTNDDESNSSIGPDSLDSNIDQEDLIEATVNAASNLNLPAHLRPISPAALTGTYSHLIL
jgi:hypothetical protein